MITNLQARVARNLQRQFFDLPDLSGVGNIAVVYSDREFMAQH